MNARAGAVTYSGVVNYEGPCWILDLDEQAGQMVQETDPLMRGLTAKNLN